MKKLITLTVLLIQHLVFSQTISCTGNTFTVNLPTAVGIQSTVYTLVNSRTGIVNNVMFWVEDF